MLTKIRLELARDHEHPEGSSAIGYEFAAPLDAAHKIDAEEWRKLRENCRVVRFRPGEADDIGHLIRKGGGSWAFHYDIDSDEEDDEAGFRFGDHAFTLGEYVSIRDGKVMHTYLVVSVKRP